MQLKLNVCSHLRMIDCASIAQGRSPFEILIEEYGTSNRERPTVSDLKDLLIKAELYRAADFVAEEFLSEQKPARPNKGKLSVVISRLKLINITFFVKTKGPAACIDIALSDDEELSTPNLVIPVPTDSTQNNNNKDLYDKSCQLKKAMPSMPSISMIDHHMIISIDDNLPKLSLLTSTSDNADDSATSKVSTDNNNIPNFSSLLLNSELEDKNNTYSASSIGTTFNSEIPNFEALDDMSRNSEESSIIGDNIIQSNIPMLSALNNDLPQLSILQQGSSNLIDFNSNYHK